MLRIAQKNTKRSFALGPVGVLWTESRVCRSLLPARQRAYTSLEKRALWWQTAQAADKSITALAFSVLLRCCAAASLLQCVLECVLDVLGTDPLSHEGACGLFAARAPGRMVCQSFVAWNSTAASVTCPPPRAVECLSLNLSS
jgi:hypothetical protein